MRAYVNKRGNLMTENISGANIIIRALLDQNVSHMFGYPGGAVLPIYDALYDYDSNTIRHILVRQEAGAVHAAEGYARSSGKTGIVLVTSGPGATNIVTGLQDALMDSIPLVCITGQVPVPLIGSDAFQEADTVGITRPCTKHNYLVRSIEELENTIHEAFYIANSGRPGPVLIDIPKNIQIEEYRYIGKQKKKFHAGYSPVLRPRSKDIQDAIALIEEAKSPIFYTGGGVINSGLAASGILNEIVSHTNFPITSTLMGLGGFPAEKEQWLGMLGMHGTYEANMAMYETDLIICVGARFDDRITGKISAFSPQSKRIHIDIDPSSINKNVQTDIQIVGDCAYVLEELLSGLRHSQSLKKNTAALAQWWKKIETWRAKKCLAYDIKKSSSILPQYAIERLYQMTADKNTYITTEVGQHQMWAAQYYQFQEPRRWITSGGLGTMGYGLPAAIGVQIAHPDSLVIDIAGEASILMNIQEMSTAVQYRLPVKVFIINNFYMGMVRQWQELLHDGRYSHSYSESLPDFVKLAEAYGGVGIRAQKVDELDDAIAEMLAVSDRPVLFDCQVDEAENCFPMIPSGKAHNEMILSKQDEDNQTISKEGQMLV